MFVEKDAQNTVANTPVEALSRAQVRVPRVGPLGMQASIFSESDR